MALHIKVEEMMWIEEAPPWMLPIIAFLKDQTLSKDNEEAYKLRHRADHHVFQDDIFYKRGFSSTHLRCTGVEEANYVL